MEHPFFPTTTTRIEALRWLSIAEKLLLTRDFSGSKSFATRARDADPSLTPAEQILAIADTLIAGERRIGNNHSDWYAVLNVVPQQGHDTDLIASQYRNLAQILNPHKNRYPLADEALRLVQDAWSVLSNPSRKSAFDKEISFTLQHQQQPDPYRNPVHQNFAFGNSNSAPQSQNFAQASEYPRSQVDQASSTPAREPQNFMNFASGSTLSFGTGTGVRTNHESVSKHAPDGHSSFGSKSNLSTAPVNNNNTQKQMKTDAKLNSSLGRIDEQDEITGSAVDHEASFWTACPYCYYMYEYAVMYADCTLKCQNCKMAFQGIAVPSPPSIANKQEGFFCCWGFIPMGFSPENSEKTKGSGSKWTPFSPMFSVPLPSKGNAPKQAVKRTSTPRIYIDDDDILDLSDSSEPDDHDWNSEIETKKKKPETVKRKGASDTPNRTEKKGKTSNVKPSDATPSQDASNKTTGESSKKSSGRKQPGRAAKKLDLNVEISNETEEPPPKVDQQAGPSRAEDDNIEGIGFFEGLDEFLSSLPILNIVADDKVVKAT